MKKKFLFIIFFAIVALFLIGGTKCSAQDLDRIKDYIVTVEPRMNDGTLDITYEIEWEVLDSTTEGPLSWVQIGTPNERFDTPTALTQNIKSISKYNGSYVKITFDRSYRAGEVIKFKYKIHQAYMYKLSWGKCKYSFTPAWFTDAEVDKLTIKWNKDSVKSSNTKQSEDNYLVWTKYKMKKGEKLKAEVKYEKTAFSGLNLNQQSSNVKQNKNSNMSFESQINIIYIVIIVIIVIVSIISGGRGGRRILRT